MRILIVSDKLKLSIPKSKSIKYTLESDPAKVLNLYKRNKFDVVITNLKVSNLNDILLLIKIKSYDPQAKVIIIGEYGNVKTAITAFNNKAHAFIYKSNPDALIKKLMVLERIIKRSKKYKDLRLFLKKIISEFRSLRAKVLHDIYCIAFNINRKVIILRRFRC